MAFSEAQPLVTVAAPADRAPEELHRRLADLADAVEARDTFIAVAGHELRNPMTPILGQVDLLLAAVRAGKCSSEQVEQRLERIQHAVRRYMRRATILLDVSRITSGKLRLEPAACDLAVVLRDATDEFTDTARRAGVAIAITVPESLPGTWDRLALEQIIDNLVSNALKYGARTPVELSAERCGEQVRIQVRDHGAGIPASDQDRIFQRFERVIGQNERRSGFGVGLWVVSQLVAAMDGTITIDDAPGGGALFTVSLPLHLEGKHQ
jgi:two-component system OmpR family sensor kinase